MGWAAGSGWMWLLMIAGTIGFWVLVALTVRAVLGGGRPRASLQVLRDRFARGELSAEDYEHRRQLLIDGHDTAPPHDSPPTTGPR